MCGHSLVLHFHRAGMRHFWEAMSTILMFPCQAVEPVAQVGLPDVGGGRKIDMAPNLEFAKDLNKNDRSSWGGSGNLSHACEHCVKKAMQGSVELKGNLINNYPTKLPIRAKSTKKTLKIIIILGSKVFPDYWTKQSLSYARSDWLILNLPVSFAAWKRCATVYICLSKPKMDLEEPGKFSCHFSANKEFSIGD